MLRYIEVDTSLSWTVELEVDEGSSLVDSVNKCRGLKLTSADFKATISIPLFDGCVLVIDSLDKIASRPVYVYCIQVSHRIEEAEIIKKIENYFPAPRQLRSVKVKPVDSKDGDHHAKGAVSYSRGAVLSLYEDRDGGNCHTSGDRIVIPHQVSEGSSKDPSVSKQRDMPTQGTLKFDEGGMGSGKVNSFNNAWESSSDCLEEDNPADMKYRTPSDTSLPNGPVSDRDVMVGQGIPSSTTSTTSTPSTGDSNEDSTKLEICSEETFSSDSTNHIHAPTDQLVEEVDKTPTDPSNKERNSVQESNGDCSEEKVFVGNPPPVAIPSPVAKPYASSHFFRGSFPASLSGCSPVDVLFAHTEEIHNIDVNAEYPIIGKGIYQYKDKYALKMTQYQYCKDIRRRLRHLNILGVIIIDPEAGLIYQVMHLEIFATLSITV